MEQRTKKKKKKEKGKEMSEVKKVSVKLGDDYLVFETGKIAKQANGAVYAHYAGSAVIATVCCGEAPIMYRSQSSTTRSTMPPERSPEDSSRESPSRRIRRSWSAVSSTARCALCSTRPSAARSRLSRQSSQQTRSIHRISSQSTQPALQ